MFAERTQDIAGRHLIVDASTFNRRNLTSTDTVFSLFEQLARNLDMTLVIPPIVCRYPFANDELEEFCDHVESELKTKARELGRESIDLELAPVKIMRENLRKRQMEDSGVTGISIWAESHAAIHTWDEDNYFSFDAFSCKEFDPADAIRLLLNTFDIETMHCVSIMRYQRAPSKIAHFELNDHWHVLIDGHKVGELDTYDFE